MTLSLSEVSALHPDLNGDGFRCERVPVRSRPIRAEEFGAALAFIEGAPTRRVVNREADSYALKHIAERIVGTYVGHGAMIAALIASGVDVQRIARTPRVVAAIPTRWVKAMRARADMQPPP